MSRTPRAAHVGVSFNRMAPLRMQLIREITCLERQLEHMKLNQMSVDFSMLQTYKEMIHCRREMLGSLPRNA